ncbi:hypothetical protein L211DRAFT_439288 [Terfezia boudieri ATCC MYA-4762]|uniref:Uncharacterized protein n=1 Tax=Terfezia boudieri ATCC MYA-4762 TaxID=1051890 RepID=A0A3N4LF41_9PEZI|nr:hypothetical protein L211DRAFT_439288 [Terfezia boudieri ATCC MYA-4762]
MPKHPNKLHGDWYHEDVTCRYLPLGVCFHDVQGGANGNASDAGEVVGPEVGYCTALRCVCCCCASDIKVEEIIEGLCHFEPHPCPQPATATDTGRPQPAPRAGFITTQHVGFYIFLSYNSSTHLVLTPYHSISLHITPYTHRDFSPIHRSSEVPLPLIQRLLL